MPVHKKIFREFDRFLDRRIGIDDPGTRKGIAIATGAVLGALIGQPLAGAAFGASSGVATATTFGISTASIIGGQIGAQLAATDISRVGESIIAGGVSPFPDTLDIGQTRLFKSLSQKRNRGRTNFTGGLSSAAPSIKPTLFTI